MDFNVDELFKHGKTPEEKAMLLECYAMMRPYIEKWQEDPLADHHALHAEMQAKLTDFFKKHNPESQ
jgi:hypothetical protein